MERIRMEEPEDDGLHLEEREEPAAPPQHTIRLDRQVDTNPALIPLDMESAPVEHTPLLPRPRRRIAPIEQDIEVSRKPGPAPPQAEPAGKQPPQTGLSLAPQSTVVPPVRKLEVTESRLRSPAESESHERSFSDSEKTRERPIEAAEIARVELRERHVTEIERVIEQQSVPAIPSRIVPVSITPRREPTAIESGRERAMEHPMTSAVPPPGPTIQVTIGRIEIRAIPSSTAVPARIPGAPRSTGMSLEDYLRQREGRKTS